MSNRFGTAPVLMGHVTAGISAHAGGTRDGRIDASDGIAAALRDVTFGGSPRVTLPAGGEVISDAVPLAVPADHDLLVSVWTPLPSGPVTYHPAAMQQSYVSTGPDDHAGDVAGTAFSAGNSGWQYVSAVDVAGGPGTVVALGDSITDGIGSTPGANRRWPDYLAARLAAGPEPDYGVVNAGISGNRVLLDSLAAAGPSAQARLPLDVLDRTGVRTVIVLEGVNDIRLEPRQTDPARIIDGLGRIAGQAHARGLRVIGATILPWRGDRGWSAQRDATREAVNAWIRAGGDGTLDGVADLDAAIRDPADPRRLRSAYDSGDHLHPSDAGDRAIADAIPLGAL
jgi:lysophospholipase L1-like esterase